MESYMIHAIRLLEESFGDNFNRFVTDWKYKNSEGFSSDDDESLANSVLMVPETEFVGGE